MRRGNHCRDLGSGGDAAAAHHRRPPSVPPVTGGGSGAHAAADYRGGAAAASRRLCRPGRRGRDGGALTLASGYRAARRVVRPRAPPPRVPHRGRGRCGGGDDAGVLSMSRPSGGRRS